MTEEDIQAFAVIKSEHVWAKKAQAIEGVQKYSIPKIQEKHLMADDHGWVVLYKDHKRIVDSQAQKIVGLQEKIDYLNGAIEKSDDERAKKIIEQAKHISLLKAVITADHAFRWQLNHDKHPDSVHIKSTEFILLKAIDELREFEEKDSKEVK